MKKKPEFRIQTITHPSKPTADYNDPLLRELVAHLRQNRTQLREEWARRITDAQLLTAMTKEEIFSEATSVYDNYVEVLETGSVEAAVINASEGRLRDDMAILAFGPTPRPEEHDG